MQAQVNTQIAGSTATEIFDSIRSQVQSGALAPGQALPTVRDLAARLGVNRNTVALAYRRLGLAGLACPQGRAGTRIRDRPAAGEQEGGGPATAQCDLGSGNPDPAWLPDLAALLAGKPYRPRLYGEPTVDAGLTALVRPWMAADCERDFELLLSQGAVDAVERLLAAHLVRGDGVAVEDPCFISSVNTLRHAGLRPIGVAMDAQGPQPDALERALAQGVRALILTPRAHNPTGACLSAHRAAELRALLARYPQVLVIADDHFALLSVAAYHHPIPAETRHWALVRSVSKALGPDLRLAFVASDAHSAQRLSLRLAPGTNWVSHLLQDAVAACLASAAVADRMARARVDYARRRAWLSQALAAQGLAPVAGADGLNLWLPLSVPSPALALALARQGWLVRGGEGFGVEAPARGLRLTVSTLGAAQAEDFARALRNALDTGADVQSVRTGSKS